jgi:hypothetical protein
MGSIRNVQLHRGYGELTYRNGRHHKVMYYPNSPRKQVPLALPGVKSRKLSLLPTEDTAVSEGIAWHNSSQTVIFIT